jgi:hypothetical protein
LALDIAKGGNQGSCVPGVLTKGGMMATSAAPESELTKLGDLLDDQSFREHFASDYKKAMKDHAVDEINVPPHVLHTLSKLTKEELAVLADVKGALKSDGILAPDAFHMV